jgi:hypothetical protein
MLVEAVAESRTMKQVFARLGIRPGRYEYLREHIARLGLDASHIPTAGAGSPNARLSWTDTQLAETVRTSFTVAEVGRRLGYKPSRRHPPHADRPLPAARPGHGAFHRAVLVTRPLRTDTRASDPGRNPGPGFSGELLGPQETLDRRRAEAGSLRGLRPSRVARRPAAAGPRPHQRRPHGQPVGEPPYPVSELPRADGHMVRAEERTNYSVRLVGVAQLAGGPRFRSETVRVRIPPPTPFHQPGRWIRARRQTP